MTAEESRAECDQRLQREAADRYWRAVADAEYTHTLDLVPPVVGFIPTDEFDTTTLSGERE